MRNDALGRSGSDSLVFGGLVESVMRSTLGVIFISVMGVSAVAQSQRLEVSRIEIATVPENRLIRPWETAVVQVRAYGEEVDSDGNKETVRLKRSPDYIRISGKNKGWLSKPFMSQTDRVQSGENDLIGALVGRASDFSIKDSVLYTAPEKTGKVQIEAGLAGKTAKVEIQVSSRAPTRRKPEATTFSKEPGTQDPYLPLAAHYSPLVAQETWFQPKSDYLARFDYDGDWRGDNNWDSLERGSSQAFVYYAVMETETHWFLVYNFFHPRDYSDECVLGTCHENDSEGMILTVSKEGSGYGRLQAMETLAHNNIYSFQANDKIKRGVHSIDGGIELAEKSHPVVFIESGGHGVYGSRSNHARFNLRTGFSAGTGVTYVYKGKAGRPRHANDQNVSYDLLPITDHWWSKVDPASDWNHRTFDDFFRYEPEGGRPAALFPSIPKAFFGRKKAANKAKPFWGWHDNRTQRKKILAVGQWGLDPAYSVYQNLRFPRNPKFSLKYIHNPFLDLGGQVARDAAPLSQRVSGREDFISQSRIQSVPRSAVLPPSPAPRDIEVSLPEMPSYRSRDYDARSKEGRLDLRLVVDGEIDVQIQGNRIRYEVKSGRRPVEDGSEFTQPIPSTRLRSFKIDKKDGRGKVEVIQQPGPDNAYTARIRISDPKGGEDRYHLEVQWKRP